MVGSGDDIHDAEGIALANEVKRIYGAKTMEQAIGVALANLLKALEKEPLSAMSFYRSEIPSEQRVADVD